MFFRWSVFVDYLVTALLAIFLGGYFDGSEVRDCKIFCVNLIIKHKFTQENINERFNRSFA